MNMFAKIAGRSSKFCSRWVKIAPGNLARPVREKTWLKNFQSYISEKEAMSMTRRGFAAGEASGRRLVVMVRVGAATGIKLPNPVSRVASFIILRFSLSYHAPTLSKLIDRVYLPFGFEIR